jgi:hypothetical protein
MADASGRPEAVDVEHVMQQLRARIRERRAPDYTEAELQQLASAKLEHLLDARGGRASALERFLQPRPPSPALPSYEFEDSTIFATHRGLLAAIRRLLRPVLKLFVNPDPVSRALHIQARLNAEYERRFRRREEMDPVFAEILRGLVVEITRAGLEIQSLRMRLESLSARLDFDERRARMPGPHAGPRPAPVRQSVAAEPGAATAPEATGSESASAPGSERRRRRRRRRRRGGRSQEAQASTPGGMSSEVLRDEADATEHEADDVPAAADDAGDADSDEP